MYYSSRKIQIWPLAIMILLLVGLTIAGLGSYQKVGANAKIQSVNQDLFSFHHALVRVMPEQDSCGDQIELELTNGADDIDIVIYDAITEMGDRQVNTTDPLIRILDKFSPDAGTVSFQLPNPLRLTEGNDVYIAVSALSPVLAADTAASGADTAYVSYDGSTWRESTLAFNIQLQTSDCGPDVPAGPVATNTPFAPTPTPTAPPTATPVPTTAPDQPTNTPTASVPAQAVCEAPPLHLRSAAVSFIEEEQAAGMPLAQESLALDHHFSAEQFNSPSAKKDALLEFYLANAPELLQPFEIAQQRLAPVQVNLPAQVAPNTTGSIFLPDGTPAHSYTIHIYEIDSQGNLSGEPVVTGTTDENGAFGLYLLSGSYLLRAEPPLKDVTGLPVDGIQTVEQLFEVGPDMVDLGQLTLPATNKVIQGQIVHTDGTRISEARVDAFNVNTGQYVYTYPDNSGNFDLHVGGGSWQVSLLPALGVSWIPVERRQDVQFERDESAETVEDLVFTVRPADVVMRGQVTDPSGQPLPSDSLEVFGLNFNARIDFFDTVTERFAYGFMDADGQFTIPLASGIYEVSVWVDSALYPQYTGTFLDDPIQITDQVLNIGQIRVLANTSTIQGIVSDSDGVPVPNVTVNVWQESGLSLNSLTDENGTYELTVPSGRWWVRPEPQDYQSQIFTDRSQRVVLDETAPTQVDFSLEPSKGLLSGTVVDDQNNLLSDVDGYVYVRRGGESKPVVSTVVENGRFSSKVPYGELEVGMFLGPDSLYVLQEEATPEDASSASEFSVALQVVPANAQVQGQLRESDGTPITGIAGDVIAIEQGRPQNWKRSAIDPEDGRYSLNLIAGTWDLLYELVVDESDKTLPKNPESPVTITAEAEATVTQNLPVDRLVLVAQGVVVDENGRAVPNALVTLRSENYESNIRSDENGQFSVYAPSSLVAEIRAALLEQKKGRRQAAGGRSPRGGGGLARRFAQLPDLTSAIVVVDVDESSGDVAEMQVVLRTSNTYLAGQVLDINQQPVEGAQVSGVNLEDAQVFTINTDANGCFSAPIKAEGEYQWQITARYQDGNGVMMESQFTMTGDAESLSQAQAASTDPSSIVQLPVDSGIAMQYRGTIPQPEIHTFAVASGWSHTLPDGFTIEIAPNAINTNQTEANIQIIPDSMLNETYFHSTVEYGYQILVSDSNGRAILDEFRSNVLITLDYPEETANEETLAVASEIDDEWIQEKRIIQNPENNTISTSIQKPGVYAVVQPNTIPALAEASAISELAAAELTGSVDANDTQVEAGGQAIWTIRVTNVGEETAEGAALIAQLPSGTEIAESSLAQGWIEQDTQLYQLTLGALTGGESISKLFAVTLSPNSSLTTVVEPHILLQDADSSESINISTGFGNNIDVERVPTSSPEVEDEDALIEHHIYLPIMAR